MLRGDPTLIIRLRARRHRGSIRTYNADLVTGVDFLRAARGALGAFAAFAAAALLRKEGGDPGGVDEVAGPAEGGEEEEVEEDARWSVDVSGRR